MNTTADHARYQDIKRQARKGHRMSQVIAYVKANPGCTKLAAAEHAGPHGSLNYGYRTVDRTIAAGYITATRAGNRYQLHYVTG